MIHLDTSTQDQKLVIFRPGDMAHLEDGLLNMHKTLGLIPIIT